MEASWPGCGAGIQPVWRICFVTSFFIGCLGGATILRFSLFILSFNLDLSTLMRQHRNCFRKKSSTRIVISALLPRPVDHSALGDKVKVVNNKLEKLCKDRKVQYLHTFRPFTKARLPVRELYTVNDQGLHLNTEGTRRLRQFFINTVAHLIHGIK